MARILLAEDDHSMRDFLTKALKRAGHEVEPVGDGEEGLEALGDRAGVFDLPKTSAQAWTAGAPIYWDPAEAEATSAADAGNVLIGCAAAAAANPSATGRVRLNGAVPAAAVPA